MNNKQCNHRIEQGRAESVLDPTIPLGYPFDRKPDAGPTIRQYYMRKCARGERVHTGPTSNAKWTRSRNNLDGIAEQVRGMRRN
jgi:hypothetical protein